MLRSLFSGISGLRSHQTMMDVVGNNIANVNTVGYKSSNVVFEDTLSQMVKGAGAPQGGNAGTNPAQVGLGVKVAGITTNYSQGAAQLTGRSTDLMIQGDGFFVVKNGNEPLYSRAGAFSLDAGGRLTTPDGMIVQGWTGVNGVIATTAQPGNVVLPIGTLLPPVGTKTTVLGGNLPADAKPGAKYMASITTYDSLGKETLLNFTFDNTAVAAPPAPDPLPSWTLHVADAADPATDLVSTGLTFDAAGQLTSPAAGSWPSFGTPAVSVDLAGLSQYGGSSTVSALSQDGTAMGSLQSFSISPDGTMVGVFSNGMKQPLAQIALAAFNNPPGLEKVGNSTYRTTVNSGSAQLGIAGGGGRGLLAGGMLEMSNVDLAAEFTNLIVSQRGFQANSRVITASDEILQDLVNLKR